MELISCTDITQKWGKEKKGVEETHKIQPFKDFCHPLTKRQKIVMNTSQEIDRENFAMLSTGTYISIMYNIWIGLLNKNYSEVFLKIKIHIILMFLE